MASSDTDAKISVIILFTLTWTSNSNLNEWKVNVCDVQASKTCYHRVIFHKKYIIELNISSTHSTCVWSTQSLLFFQNSEQTRHFQNKLSVFRYWWIIVSVRYVVSCIDISGTFEFLFFFQKYNSQIERPFVLQKNAQFLSNNKLSNHVWSASMTGRQSIYDHGWCTI